MPVAAHRASTLTSMAVLAAMLTTPAAAMARAKDQAVALAYDASLLAGNDQPANPATPSGPATPSTPAGSDSRPVSMVTAPDAYGATSGNAPVSYNGEVQDGDPTSTPVANRASRATIGRTGSPGSKSDAQEVDGGGGGDSDTAFAPGAMLPGQLSTFGARPVAGRRIVIRPYIEAQQIAEEQLSPGGGGLLTYSVLAAGGDALINTHSTQGAISLRYERRFGWGSRTNSGDALTGVANASTRITEGLHLDYGGYANRFQSSYGGAAFAATNNSGDQLSQVYSAYAGPTLATNAGDVSIKGAYHAGYTRVINRVNGTSAGSNALGNSVAQDARLAVGTQPGGLGLPVGVGVEGGYYHEDISNLQQRVTDMHASAKVIVPVTSDLALIGAVGAEKVRVSSRDAVRDANGDPVVDASGRYVTDYNSPRYIAFDTSGLIWDVGAQWHPSARISAEGHVGRRYGRLGGYGVFKWQPGDRTVFTVTAYENLTGFGGALATALSGGSTQFTAIRDSITGNLTSCVGSLGGGGGGTCIGSATGSLNSQVYRGRGVTASLMRDLGRWQVGVSAGWDKRIYIAAPQTVLAEINGKADQYFWVAGYAGGKVSQRSSIQTTLELYKFESGLVANGDLESVRAMGVYSYFFTHNITGNASLALTGSRREQADDLWTAQGALGVRYSF